MIRCFHGAFGMVRVLLRGQMEFDVSEILLLHGPYIFGLLGDRDSGILLSGNGGRGRPH